MKEYGDIKNAEMKRRLKAFRKIRGDENNGKPVAYDAAVF